MSVRLHDILYKQIDSTRTARVGDGSSSAPNAVDSAFNGEVNILPKVNINGISCTVIEVSTYVFFCAYKVTNVTIPDTVTILKHRCFGFMSLVSEIVIPASVTTVETYCISDMKPSIYFCGTKEPEMVQENENYYISGQFTGSVVVPIDYEPDKSTFLKKSITRSSFVCQIISSLSSFKKRRSCICRRCSQSQIHVCIFLLLIC